MGKLIIGLVIGLALGAGGGWLIAKISVVDAVEQKLIEEKSLSETNRKELEKLQTKYDGLVESSATELAQVKSQLEEKEAQITALKTKNEESAPAMKKLQAETEQLIELVEKYRKECDDLMAGPAEAEPEDEEAAHLKEILSRMRRITPIGGPLNDVVVKELGLDENQVAGINGALKEEGKRMHAHLAQWADKYLSDKNLEQLMKMTDLEISVAIMPLIKEERELLAKRNPEDIKAMQLGEKHFIKLLPKDSKMREIVKSFYEERQKTYENMIPYLSPEEEKAVKEKYIQSATFMFPGNAGYGTGHLTPEDFEE
jgi:hypothetical protein